MLEYNSTKKFNFLLAGGIACKFFVFLRNFSHYRGAHAQNFSRCEYKAFLKISEIGLRVILQYIKKFQILHQTPPSKLAGKTLDLQGL